MPRISSESSRSSAADRSLTVVTCHSTFSAGYMLSAWHDLGFRDEPVLGRQALNPVDVLVSHYDDANILGFDGFFARVEFAY